MNSHDVVLEIQDDKFHAVSFDYGGNNYTFSGWWILDWGTGDRIYDSKEEFLYDYIVER